MFTSLKVVSMAAVCCAATRRSATRWRRRDIGSRRRSPGVAAGNSGVAGKGAEGTGDAAAGTAGVTVVAAAGCTGFSADTGGAMFSPVSITATTSTALTTAPSGWRSSTRVPDAGAGISRITLSVSRSTRVSSRATVSPTCLRHGSRVPLAIESDRVGTRTSSFTGILQRIVQQRFQFRPMAGYVARRRRGGRGPARIMETVPTGCAVIEMVQGLVPRALVNRFFLCPDECPGQRIGRQDGPDRRLREGIELLHPHQRDLVQPARRFVFFVFFLFVVAARHHM